MEVRKEPNITYIEGYNGTLLDPNKVAAAADDDDDNDDDDAAKNGFLDNINDDVVVEVTDSNTGSLSSVSSYPPTSDNTRAAAKTKTTKKSGALVLSLTCTTESAKPPVTHKWIKIIGDKEVSLTPVNSEITQVNDITGVSTTKSTVRLHLSPRDKVSRKSRYNTIAEEEEEEDEEVRIGRRKEDVGERKRGREKKNEGEREQMEGPLIQPVGHLSTLGGPWIPLEAPTLG